MQRYRKKLRDKEATLDADVEGLQQDIHALQLHRQTLLAGATEISVWHAVAEFFRLFQCGLKESQAATELCTAQEDSISRGYHAQRGFVYATMSPDVIGRTGCGVEKLLEYFHTVARCIPNMSTKIVRLKNGARNPMIAITEVEVTFAVNTIRLAFPHLICAGKWSSLASKLLSQRFVTQGSTHFEWDDKTSRVSILRSTADLLTLMLQLLGDLAIVSRVFNNALITPELVPVPTTTSDYGEFQPLIVWHQLTEEARAALNSADFGEAKVPFNDENFPKKLKEARSSREVTTDFARTVDPSRTDF